MAQNLRELSSAFRALPGSLKLVAHLYLDTAAGLVGYGATLVLLHRLDYAEGVAVGSMVALSLFLVAGMLQRSTFLRWICVVIAAGALVSLLLSRPPWQAPTVDGMVLGWTRLVLSALTIVAFNTGAADRWYRNVPAPRPHTDH